MNAAPAVIGLDLGSSSVKAIAFDPGGAALASHAIEVAIEVPTPDRAEQNPDELVAAAAQVVARVVGKLEGRELAGVGCSGATQSLLALDEAGRPLTRALLFADNRAAAQARGLAAQPGAVALARRTGTPLHPMSPLTKLRWFAECDPGTVERARWWVSTKEYLLRALCGAEVVDHSIASTTGLFNLEARDWDPEALALAGVGADVLSTPVPTTAVRYTRADRFGLPAGTPVVVGACDGCLAALGVGAIDQGTAALSVGTSGAIRMIVDRPGADEGARLFCYALTDERWVVGGPISNGGLVLRWARDALFPQLGSYARVDELAVDVRPGADGLLFLPYLLGERAPLWDPTLRAAFVGLSARHGQGHLLRAMLEGVAYQLATVLELVDGLAGPVTTLRADGGFTGSPLWLQIVADVLNRTLELPRWGEGVRGDAPGDGEGVRGDAPAATEGACRGAALLALDALGLADAFALARTTPVVRTVRPDPTHADRYQRLLPLFVLARDRLVEVSAALSALPVR